MDRTESVRAIYDSFGAGDGARLAEILGDTHWTEAEGMPYGGVYRGFDEVAANVFGPIGRDVEGFTAIPDEIIPAGDDRVLAMGRKWRFRPRGHAIRAPLDRSRRPRDPLRPIRRYAPLPASGRRLSPYHS